MISAIETPTLSSIMLSLHHLLIICIVWHKSASAQSTESPCPTGCHCDFETRTVNCQPGSFTSIPSNFPSYATTLILSSNVLTDVPADSFLELPNLASLDLTSCQIRTIAPGAFNGLGNLRILNLRFNSLASLSPGVFTGLSDLRELNLERNQLQILQEGIFQEMPKLQVLIVNNNPVIQIQDGAFTNLSSISALYLRYGQLTEVPQRAITDMTTLQILALSGNPIPEIPARAFESLNSLTLLYLDNMELSSLDEESFTGLQEITTIDFAYNNLRVINPAALQFLTALDTLILTGNLWDCSCSLLEFLQWLQQSSIDFYSTSWYCVTPSNLNGYVVYGVDDKDFACAPVITSTRTNIVVGYNERAILECRANADPDPTIQWYGPDGSQITATTSLENVYTALSGNVLVIQFALEENSGVFNCTATNERGSASILFQVLVTDIPSPEPSTQPDTGNGNAVTPTSPQPNRISCLNNPLETRVESVTDTSILVSWTPYNGYEVITGYIVQAHIFSDIQTNSYYVNWTMVSYELTNLFPNTDYTICAAFLLEDCPLLIPRSQCREVTTQGDDQVVAAANTKHRNEIIGTALAAGLGVLFLMASVFLILWHCRKPKKYSQYDFKGTRDTAAFADIPEGIDTGGVLIENEVRNGIVDSGEKTYTNLGMEISPEENENLYDNASDKKSLDYSTIEHSAVIEISPTKRDNQYDNFSGMKSEDSSINEYSASKDILPDQDDNTSIMKSDDFSINLLTSSCMDMSTAKEEDQCTSPSGVQLDDLKTSNLSAGMEISPDMQEDQCDRPLEIKSDACSTTEVSVAMHSSLEAKEAPPPYANDASEPVHKESEAMDTPTLVNSSTPDASEDTTLAAPSLVETTTADISVGETAEATEPTTPSASGTSDVKKVKGTPRERKDKRSKAKDVLWKEILILP